MSNQAEWMRFTRVLILLTACQLNESADDISLERIQTISTTHEDSSGSSGEPSCKESVPQPGTDLSHPALKGLPIDRLRRAVRSLGFMIRLQKRGVSA